MTGKLLGGIAQNERAKTIAKTWIGNKNQSILLTIPLELTKIHNLDKPAHVILESRQEGILIKKLNLEGRKKMILDTDKFIVDIVTDCLTKNCKECTGSYVNKILKHRLICKHYCHRDEGKDHEGQIK